MEKVEEVEEKGVVRVALPWSRFMVVRWSQFAKSDLKVYEAGAEGKEAGREGEREERR